MYPHPKKKKNTSQNGCHIDSAQFDKNKSYILVKSRYNVMIHVDLYVRIQAHPSFVMSRPSGPWGPGPPSSPFWPRPPISPGSPFSPFTPSSPFGPWFPFSPNAPLCPYMSHIDEFIAKDHTIKIKKNLKIIIIILFYKFLYLCGFFNACFMN